MTIGLDNDRDTVDNHPDDSENSCSTATVIRPSDVFDTYAPAMAPSACGVVVPMVGYRPWEGVGREAVRGGEDE